MTRRPAKEFDAPPAPVADIRQQDESRLTAALKSIVQDAEDMRLHAMKRLQSRRFMTLSLGLVAALGGAAGFGWFFLMQFDLIKAILCLLPALLFPLFLTFWSDKPAQAYRRDFKASFMPRLAEALGGFKFYQERGVSAKVLPHTGLIPPHDDYRAEDCFFGTYKGVKVIFSEARLFARKKQLFSGIFVLLETAEAMFEGCTIITADQGMAKQMAATRWRDMTEVPVQTSNPDWNRFAVFSDKPDLAKMLCGEKLCKELAEACDAFGGAAASAAFFKGKYIFIMIPEKKDLFEPSDISVPVTMHGTAQDFRREIIRLLEIVDIFEIYQVTKSP